MGNEISKEQLIAFTEATTKSATELEKIVSALHLIVEKQDKIVDRIFNGMVDEIVDGVTKNYNNTHKETIDCLSRLEECHQDIRSNFPDNLEKKLQHSPWAKDIEHTKWFIAIVGVVVIVATVILRGLDSHVICNQDVLEIKKAIATIAATNRSPAKIVANIKEE